MEESNVQQEKDALEVIAALQRENESKDSQIKKLRDDIDKIQEQSVRKEAELRDWSDKRVEGNYLKKIPHSLFSILMLMLVEMNSLLHEKDAAFKVMQQEFAVIKDFRVRASVNLICVISHVL